LADDLHFDEKHSRPGLTATNKGDKALDNFFLYFIKTLITVERGGKNEHFRVGDGFSDTWDLNNMDEKALSKWKVFLLAIWTFIKRLFKSNSSQATRAK